MCVAQCAVVADRPQHESAEAKWTGTLERKKRFAKSYVEVKVVVTASGFLHTYPLKSDSSDPKAALCVAQAARCD